MENGYFISRMIRLKESSRILIGIALGIVAALPLWAQTHTFGNPEVFQWAPTRTYHVEKYKLAMHFDQPNGEIFGDETITLTPFMGSFRKFYLNSAELTIDSVSLIGSTFHKQLTYASQESRLWITLDHAYDANERIEVRIVYHGFPRTGLFFVNPSADYPNWPTEVYSQGEPELNRYWFPCWDYPNDMARSETITTVPVGQVVVSNGKLVSVTHRGREVTYDWLESVPHSSYLISIAAGPWSKISDHYENKPVDYYVPKTVDEATARRSFRLTPDMIGFFSRATGVDYPYEQYAQTTVQNYMFGGQENVSATTLTDLTLHDARADQDFPSTNLVSHELGQHWFGDFVQGRDWADIWLNEGFATYLETLYLQWHAGNDAYRFEVYQDQLAAQQEERNAYQRPIVDRHYDDPLEMFDATTHEKGAAVLEMLRFIIDGSQAAMNPASQTEPFFRALHKYLIQHHEQNAGTADLIQAIRESTGEELDWFFREWVFLPGHPEYRVEANYDTGKKAEELIVTQIQDTTDGVPVFEMPIELAFHGPNGEYKEAEIHDSAQRQTFEVSLDFAPKWIDFDPYDFIDKTLEFKQSTDSLIAEAEKDPIMMCRLWAAQQLAEGKAADLADADTRVAALGQVLSDDSFYAVRAAAAASLGRIRTPKAKAALLTALKQKDSRVRAAVIEALGSFSKEQEVFESLVTALHDDPSYAVETAAARDIGGSGLSRAFDVLQSEIQSNPEIHVMQATLAALSKTDDARAIEILVRHARPGVPERIRLYALTALERTKGRVTANQAPELTAIVAAALHDPFYPVQQAGEELVGIYDLSQFEPEIQKEAETAPMAIQRKPAQMVLDQLHRQR